MTYDEFIRRWRRATFDAAQALHRENFDLYETREALAYFGRNLAVVGALCAAEQIGFDPPIRWRTIADGPHHVARVPNTWQAGCQWPAEKPEGGWQP